MHSLNFCTIKVEGQLAAPAAVCAVQWLGSLDSSAAEGAKDAAQRRAA
jgi:hypothetical protein